MKNNDDRSVLYTILFLIVWSGITIFIYEYFIYDIIESGPAIDDEIKNERDSIKSDSIVIDSIINEREENESIYIEKTDSVCRLSDSASVVFFREYIRHYNNRFGKNIDK